MQNANIELEALNLEISQCNSIKRLPKAAFFAADAESTNDFIAGFKINSNIGYSIGGYKRMGSAGINYKLVYG